MFTFAHIEFEHPVGKALALGALPAMYDADLFLLLIFDHVGAISMFIWFYYYNVLVKIESV